MRDNEAIFAAIFSLASSNKEHPLLLYFDEKKKQTSLYRKVKLQRKLQRRDQEKAASHKSRIIRRLCNYLSILRKRNTCAILVTESRRLPESVTFNFWAGSKKKKTPTLYFFSQPLLGRINFSKPFVCRVQIGLKNKPLEKQEPDKCFCRQALLSRRRIVNNNTFVKRGVGNETITRRRLKNAKGT